MAISRSSLEASALSSGDVEGGYSGAGGKSLSADASSTVHGGPSDESTHEGSDHPEGGGSGNGYAPCEIAHDGVGSGSEGKKPTPAGDEAERAADKAADEGAPVDVEALALSHGQTARTEPATATAAA
jgi:hypothetical protein